MAIGTAINGLMMNLSIIDKGLPVMAMTSVFASPLFNICIALSIVFLLMIYKNDNSIKLLSEEDQALYLPLAFIAIPLFLLEFVLIAVYNNFEFTKKIGVLLQVGYLRFFIVPTVLLIIELSF